MRALATTMPNPRLRTERRCHSLVPARCNRNGTCTNTVPLIERATALQIKRRPVAVEGWIEKSERSRSQIIG